MIHEKLVEEIIDTMKEITEEINKIAQEKNDHSSTGWTEIVLAKFTELGIRNEYKAFSSKDKNEWLYDLCWRKFFPPEKEDMLEEMPLVLESEWQNKGDVIFDFQKLLQSKAKYKIMIYQKHTIKTNNLLRQMYDNIQKYWLSPYDECYFLMESQQQSQPYELIVYPVFTKTKISLEILKKTRDLSKLNEPNIQYPMENISGEKGILRIEGKYRINCNSGVIHEYRDIDYLVSDGWVIEE